MRGELDASDLPIESPAWFDEHELNVRETVQRNAWAGLLLRGWVALARGVRRVIAARQA